MKLCFLELKSSIFFLAIVLACFCPTGYADIVVDGTGVVCRQHDACVKLMETFAIGGSEAEVSALSANEGSD